MQWFVTQSKLPLTFTQTLPFPLKIAYFLNDSYDSDRNVNDNSKFHITNLIPF